MDCSAFVKLESCGLTLNIVPTLQSMINFEVIDIHLFQRTLQTTSSEIQERNREREKINEYSHEFYTLLLTLLLLESRPS